MPTAGRICLAQSESPSLAETAKQTRQDKKAVLVLTEDDIRPSGATPGTSAASHADASKNTESPGNASGKKNSADNALSANDTTSVDELKKKIDTLKEQQDAWKRSAKRYEDLLANETSDFRRQMYQDALDNDRKNTKFYQEKVDQVQADLAKAQQASGASGADRQPNKPPAGGNPP
jgi:hypothetical protein